MNATTRIQSYLVRADLDRYLVQTPVIAKNIHAIMAAMGGLPPDFHLDTLYTYAVPQLGDDGACSLIDDMSPTPYDLAVTLGGRTDANTRKLLLLNQVVEHVTQMSGADSNTEKFTKYLSTRVASSSSSTWRCTRSSGFSRKRTALMIA